MNSRKTAGEGWQQQSSVWFRHQLVGGTHSVIQFIDLTVWLSCLGESDLYGHWNMSPSDFLAKSLLEETLDVILGSWTPSFGYSVLVTSCRLIFHCRGFILRIRRWPTNHRVRESNLVDSASSHTLVSKIKPCMSKYNSFTLKTANGSLYQL